MAATREMSVVRAICVLTAVGLLGVPARAKYSGGSGTAKDPWRIATKKDLLALAADTKDYASHFVLTADIDLSGKTYTMALIAPATKLEPNDAAYAAVPFTGVFDGNGRKIKGLTINESRYGHGYLGLFGCIAQGGLVRNLHMERVSVVGADNASHVGGLAGLNRAGTITGCSLAGDVSGDVLYLGGLAGRNDAGSITHCTVTGDVTGRTGSFMVGALVGKNDMRGRIEKCHALGGTTRGRAHIGGLAGENAFGAIITRCDAAGTVSDIGNPGPDAFGGLVGQNLGAISHCEAFGDVTGSVDTGGLVGSNVGLIVHCHAGGSVVGRMPGFGIGGLVGLNGGTIVNCYADGSVAGGTPGPGTAGLVGTNTRGGIIADSYATGNVNGPSVAASGGGLVGDSLGLITHCYATGNVVGKGAGLGGLVGLHGGVIVASYAGGDVAGGDGTEYAGGLAARCSPGGIMIDCYATGSVTGGALAVGGLVGAFAGEIINCYATGRATGAASTTGGLIGTSILPGQIVDSFWDVQTSGQSKSIGGTGKTTAQMQLAKTFLDVSWDLDCTWDIVDKKTYPFLRPGPAGDLTCDEKVNLRDFAVLAANWSKHCGVSTNPKRALPECPLAGDLNYDKKVDGVDLGLIAAEWLDSRAQTASQ